jgi:hypothetical protein
MNIGVISSRRQTYLSYLTNDFEDLGIDCSIALYSKVSNIALRGDPGSDQSIQFTAGNIIGQMFIKFKLISGRGIEELYRNDEVKLSIQGHSCNDIKPRYHCRDVFLEEAAI